VTALALVPLAVAPIAWANTGANSSNRGHGLHAAGALTLERESGCPGRWRWNVKTLTDKPASGPWVNFSSRLKTVAELGDLQEPGVPINSRSVDVPRQPGPERRTYRVNCARPPRSRSLTSPPSVEGRPASGQASIEAAAKLLSGHARRSREGGGDTTLASQLSGDMRESGQPPPESAPLSGRHHRARMTLSAGMSPERSGSAPAAERYWQSESGETPSTAAARPRPCSRTAQACSRRPASPPEPAGRLRPRPRNRGDVPRGGRRQSFAHASVNVNEPDDAREVIPCSSS
jgi:hypothetical protein